MDFAPVPACAAWQHRGARDGFEVAYFEVLDQGWRIEGVTAAIEGGVTWAAEYGIDLDAAGATRGARIRGRSAAGSPSALLEAYLRAPDEAARQSRDYAAPVFDFACRIAHDESGLVLDYPGIAVRAG